MPAPSVTSELVTSARSRGRLDYVVLQLGAPSRLFSMHDLKAVS